MCFTAEKGWLVTGESDGEFDVSSTKQSQFPRSPNAGLSFLSRFRVRDKLQQESRLFDGSGFRIKCGMTGSKGRLTEHGSQKQSQFGRPLAGSSKHWTLNPEQAGYWRLFVVSFEKTKPISEGPAAHGRHGMLVVDLAVGGGYNLGRFG